MGKPKRYRAEVMDKMQFCYGDYNDHQVRGVIYFNGAVNGEYMKRAVLMSMKYVPILACRFAAAHIRPYWEALDPLDENNLFSFVESEDPENCIQTFISGKTDELAGPQIKTRLIRSAENDVFCVVLNHMVCDGTGMKDYLYRLSDIYSSLLDGASELPPCKPGERSLEMVYSGFDFVERMKVKRLPVENVKSINPHRFPIETGDLNRTPFIIKHRMDQESFVKIKEFGKKQGATVNDVVVAACYRAIYKLLALKEAETLIIPSMVDLRKYIPRKKDVGISNQVSMIMCRVTVDGNEGFETTLRKVSAEMARRKNGYPGLYGLSTLNAALKFIPFGVVRKHFKKFFINPNLSVTNIGIIDLQKLQFKGAPVGNAFITSSIKYPPYFQLAFTSFSGTMTLCVNLYGTENDKGTVQQFFSLLDNEFKSIVTR